MIEFPYTDSPLCDYKGIPVFCTLRGGEMESALSDDIAEYVRRFEVHVGRRTYFDEHVLKDVPEGSNVISAGEGTGEVVASLARKWPGLKFYAFDLSPRRVAIAQRLVSQLGIGNVRLHVGSASSFPFPDRFFAAAYERGLFHILPRDVKVRNLEEIKRVCAGPVLLDWMTNANIYLLKKFIALSKTKNYNSFIDAFITYKLIERRCNTLRRIARFVAAQTGIPAEVVHNYSGRVELSYNKKGVSNYKEHLGSVYFRARD